MPNGDVSADPELVPTAPAVALYLDLLKRCLTREIFMDEQVVDAWWWRNDGPLGDLEETRQILRERNLRIVQAVQIPEERRDGRDWYPTAETMVGPARLDNVQDLVTRIVHTGVPGDLVETGVWRGGTITLMRAMLAVLGDAERVVWACDSFQGLPEPDVDRYPEDAAFKTDDPFAMGWTDVLAVSVEQVKATLARYGLLDDRVRFIEGWFKDTLPQAPIEQIALLRLDGDFYESTMDGLMHLEPKVTDGGFVIVDDYNALEACRRAVGDYRSEAGIDDPIHQIDWAGVWWQKRP